MSNIPKWAQDLLINACIFLQNKEYKADLPIIIWRHGTNQLSSGNASKERIVITAGRNRTDQRLVLLHEYAHTLPETNHHDAAFWDIAWILYREFKVPIRYALNRERGYRKEAIKAYHRSKCNTIKRGIT